MAAERLPSNGSTMQGGNVYAGEQEEKTDHAEQREHGGLLIVVQVFAEGDAGYLIAWRRGGLCFLDSGSYSRE